MQPNPMPRRNVRFEQFDGHSINGVYVLLPENEVQAVKLISIKLANKQIKNCADVTKFIKHAYEITDEMQAQALGKKCFQ